MIIIVERILEVIMEIELTECNKIIELDYRGYVFDIDIKIYFKDKINIIKVNRFN